jgi:hypothetical protein
LITSVFVSDISSLSLFLFLLYSGSVAFEDKEDDDDDDDDDEEEEEEDDDDDEENEEVSSDDDCSECLKSTFVSTMHVFVPRKSLLSSLSSFTSSTCTSLSINLQPAAITEAG